MIRRWNWYQSWREQILFDLGKTDKYNLFGAPQGPVLQCRFNFKGGDQQKRVDELSGGERGRLQLAATLKHGGNVLLGEEAAGPHRIKYKRIDA